MNIGIQRCDFLNYCRIQLHKMLIKATSLGLKQYNHNPYNLNSVTMDSNRVNNNPLVRVFLHLSNPIKLDQAKGLQMSNARWFLNLGVKPILQQTVLLLLHAACGILFCCVRGFYTHTTHASEKMMKRAPRAFRIASSPGHNSNTSLMFSAQKLCVSFSSIHTSQHLPAW